MNRRDIWKFPIWIGTEVDFTDWSNANFACLAQDFYSKNLSLFGSVNIAVL